MVVTRENPRGNLINTKVNVFLSEVEKPFFAIFFVFFRTFGLIFLAFVMMQKRMFSTFDFNRYLNLKNGNFSDFDRRQFSFDLNIYSDFSYR